MEVEGEGPFVRICVTPTVKGTVRAFSFGKTNPAASCLGGSQVPRSQWEKATGLGTWAFAQTPQRKSFHANLFDIRKPLFTDSEFGWAIPNDSGERKFQGKGEGQQY